MIGYHTYTVAAYLTNYPSISDVVEGGIEFIEPCADPESVEYTIQENPDNYLYTVEKMSFTLKPFVVVPSICEFKYSCAMIAGDRLDLC